MRGPLRSPRLRLVRKGPQLILRGVRVEVRLKALQGTPDSRGIRSPRWPSLVPSADALRSAPLKVTLVSQDRGVRLASLTRTPSRWLRWALPVWLGLCLPSLALAHGQSGATEPVPAAPAVQAGDSQPAERGPPRPRRWTGRTRRQASQAPTNGARGRRPIPLGCRGHPIRLARPTPLGLRTRVGLG